MPILVVLDLDETLGVLSPRDIISQNVKLSDFFIMRPYAKEFIRNNILVGNDVAIWSRGGSTYVNEIILLFEAEFKFVWTRDNCDNGQKNLMKILDAFPEYRKKDIIFYDNDFSHTNFNRNSGFFCVKVPDFIVGTNDYFFR